MSAETNTEAQTENTMQITVAIEIAGTPEEFIVSTDHLYIGDAMFNACTDQVVAPSENDQEYAEQRMEFEDNCSAKLMPFEVARLKASDDPDAQTILFDYEVYDGHMTGHGYGWDSSKD